MTKIYNRAGMTVSGTPGTGTITLNAAITSPKKYLSFASAGVSNLETIAYLIEDGAEFETGIGTYTSSGTTLSRDTVWASSNGGAKISATSAALVYIDATQQIIANLGEANTFTANQQIEASNDGASADPKLHLNRISASPAAADLLGQVNFFGRDSGGNQTEYTSLTGEIVDPTNGSEDGSLVVNTMVAGTAAARFKFRQGLLADSLTDKGAGSVNATGFYVNDTAVITGKVIKTSDTTRNTNTTTSADPALQFSMAASTIYDIRIVIRFRSTAAGDLKWGLAGPSSPTEVYGGYSMDNSGAVTKGFEAYPTNLAQLQGGDGARVLWIDLTVENVNSGTFSFDWAQNTSDAGPTTVKAGSFIEYLAR